MALNNLWLTAGTRLLAIHSMDHKFSVAPMLDWTDKHCRYFHRLMTKHAVLYTEMVTTGALIHGKGDYLAFNEQEHPLVLQLGGSNPAEMAQCAKWLSSEDMTRLILMSAARRTGYKTACLVRV